MSFRLSEKSTEEKKLYKLHERWSPYSRQYLNVALSLLFCCFFALLSPLLSSLLLFNLSPSICVWMLYFSFHTYTILYKYIWITKKNEEIILFFRRSRFEYWVYTQFVVCYAYILMCEMEWNKSDEITGQKRSTWKWVTTRPAMTTNTPKTRQFNSVCERNIKMCNVCVRTRREANNSNEMRKQQQRTTRPV